MPMRNALLPREGFNADVVLKIIKKTALNPGITLPLLLLSHLTPLGQRIASDYEVSLGRLKILFYLGLVHWINGILSNGVLNNWESSRYEWEKEIAVVTGGSDGLGKYISLQLAEQGVKVAVLDIQPLNFEARSNIHFYGCDITSPDAVSRTAATIRENLGAPTLLFNNAGVANILPILSTTEDSLARTFNVNILSHFRLVKEFLPAMISANHGTVVTTASLAASVTSSGFVDYCCTKAAALAFHEGLAAELKTEYSAPKVRTVCILPGWIDTALIRGRGIQNNSKFLMPTLSAETVADTVVKKVLTGTSGIIILPQMGVLVGWTVRFWPMWLQSLIRSRTSRSVGTKK